MITIGWCSSKNDFSFREYINTYFKGNVEIIEKICRPEEGYYISQAYNDILNESSNDIVVLMHNNVFFKNSDKYPMPVDESLEFQFKHHENLGILGIFGRCQNERDICARESDCLDYNFNECNNDLSFERNVSNDFLTKKYSLEVIDDGLIDGCFMAVKKSRLKSRFSDDNKTFHFYDLDLCVSNYVKGVGIGITKALEIIHIKTENDDAVAWSKYNEVKPEFINRWKSVLPLSVANKSKELLILTAVCRPEYMDVVGESIVKFREYLENVHITWMICYDIENMKGDLSNVYKFCDENKITWYGYPSGKKGQKNYGGDMFNEAIIWSRENLYKNVDPWVYILDDDNLMCTLMADQYTLMTNTAELNNKPCIWMAKNREDGFVDTVKRWAVYSKGKNNHTTYADEFLPDPSQLLMKLSLIETFGYFKSGFSYDQYLWWYFYEHNDLVLYPEDWLGIYWDGLPSNNIYQCYHDGITSVKEMEDILDAVNNNETIDYSLVVCRNKKIDRIHLDVSQGENILKDMAKK